MVNVIVVAMQSFIQILQLKNALIVMFHVLLVQVVKALIVLLVQEVITYKLKQENVCMNA